MNRAERIEYLANPAEPKRLPRHHLVVALELRLSRLASLKAHAKPAHKTQF